MPWDRTQATAYLGLHCPTDADPPLTTAEVDLILDGAKRPDADGRLPADDGWTDTYDARAAIAEAWRAKAARAARRVDISRGGESVKRSALVENCLRMARLWSRPGDAAMVSPGLAALEATAGNVLVVNGPDILRDGAQVAYTGSDSWSEAS
jgi:hypothetical protein